MSFVMDCDIWTGLSGPVFVKDLNCSRAFISLNGWLLLLSSRSLLVPSSSQEDLSRSIEQFQQSSLDQPAANSSKSCLSTADGLSNNQLEDVTVLKSSKRPAPSGSTKHSSKKRLKRTTAAFDPVSEHRCWCPWVSSQSDYDDYSRPWLRLLRILLMPDDRAGYFPTPAVGCSSPSREALESIRNLFRSWTSSPK